MENSFKKNLIAQMLDYVPDLGWTWDALHKAAKIAKTDKNSTREELQTLFENKISNIIGTFNDKLDDDMYLIFNAESNKDLGTTDTVKALILSRLKASSNYKSIIKTSLFFMAQPRNAHDAFNQLMKTSNKIWEIVGDTSGGRTFWSKRLILSGVYSSTLAHWLAKENRSIEESEDFLDRRLDDVKNFGKISKQSIEVFEKTKRELDSILKKHR
jgi:ubiquinone biosynthesis protein COQ9